MNLHHPYDLGSHVMFALALVRVCLRYHILLDYITDG